MLDAQSMTLFLRICGLSCLLLVRCDSDFGPTGVGPGGRDASGVGAAGATDSGGTGAEDASRRGDADAARGAAGAAGAGGNTPDGSVPDAAHGGASDAETGCSRSRIEAKMRGVLANVQTDVDFALHVERSGGEVFRFQRGTATLTTPYESASTSKLVTAAVILWLVEQGVLSLDDRPSDILPAAVWDLDPSDPLSSMTLEHLLSFTSGLRTEPGCINLGAYDFDGCVANAAVRNAGNGAIPGNGFNYNSAHMQVAGAMAVHASAAGTWHALFAAFKDETGLFPNSDYDLPSASNPRLAGGMHWTGEDYVDFMRAYRDGSFAPRAFGEAVVDHTIDVVMELSPSIERLSETWHYGLGLWLECRSRTFDCAAVSYVSSPGAYGAYPFFHLGVGFFGLLARQGALRTFPNGVQVVDAVRGDMEAWAVCESP